MPPGAANQPACVSRPHAASSPELATAGGMPAFVPWHSQKIPSPAVIHTQVMKFDWRVIVLCRF